MKERERHLYFKGRFAYSFGKNGGGLSDEFGVIHDVISLLSKDNFITIHKTFIDQLDDVYDIVFDCTPKSNVDYLVKDKEDEKELEYRS